MINNNAMKISWVFSTFMLMYFCVYGQNDTATLSKNYRWCIEWLDEMKPAIIADSMGRYRAKWSAVDRLLKEGCDFVGELFPVVEYYFGLPDKKLNYSTNEYITHKDFSMRYVLFKPPGTSTTGMKSLIVDCDNDYRIIKFWNFTVDE